MTFHAILSPILFLADPLTLPLPDGPPKDPSNVILNPWQRSAPLAPPFIHVSWGIKNGRSLYFLMEGLYVFLGIKVLFFFIRFYAAVPID